MGSRRYNTTRLVGLVIASPIVLPTIAVVASFLVAKEHYKDRKKDGFPPTAAPGDRLVDYYDQIVRHPLQRHRRNKSPPAYPDENGEVLSLSSELWEMVIDYLSDDKPALKSCSLVSWTFVSRTRFHLFHIVHPFRRSAYSFATLVCSPHSTFHRHIRELVISDWEKWRIVEGVMLLLAAHDVHLQTLDLELCREFSPRSLSKLSNLTRDTTSLTLKLQRNAFGNSVPRMMQFLTLFPKLEELTVFTLRDYNRRPMTSAGEGRVIARTALPSGELLSPHLHSLSIISPLLPFRDDNAILLFSPAALALTWRLFEHNPQLNTLNFRSHLMDNADVVRLTSYLKQCGPSISTFSMTVNEIGSSSSLEMIFPKEQLDAPILPNLRCLYLYIVDYYVLETTLSDVIRSCAKLRDLHVAAGLIRGLSPESVGRLTRQLHFSFIGAREHYGHPVYWHYSREGMVL